LRAKYVGMIAASPSHPKAEPSISTTVPKTKTISFDSPAKTEIKASPAWGINEPNAPKIKPDKKVIVIAAKKYPDTNSAEYLSTSLFLFFSSTIEKKANDVYEVSIPPNKKTSKAKGTKLKETLNRTSEIKLAAIITP
jgi:hypothetical protein